MKQPSNRRRSAIRWIALGLALAPAAAAKDPEATASGVSGLVSSAHPLASEAGLEVLRAGGNAFDAAVATAATLGVVEPMMSGVGGYGTIVIYDARKRQTRFLNSSGRIPRSVDSDAFRPPTPDYLGNRRGAKSVSTPGTVASWEAMSRQYGKLPWKRLFDQAIKLARDGFPVDQATAGMIQTSFESFPEAARGFYGRNGKPLVAGDRLVQRDLSRSLSLIAAQGTAPIASGELARAIDSAMRAAGGFLSIDDLKANRAEWGEPIKLSYRGYDVVTAPPPANAFDMLVRLGLMSRYDVRSLGHNTSAHLHRFAEATKHGFWVRLRHAADPEVEMPPLGKLLSPEYFAAEAAKIDPERARAFEPPRSFQPERHTTHFVVADRWGNVVSATQTLGGLFGSKIMPEGTGIWLNDSLEFCTFEPKGNPMDAHAGRRKLSGDCPTLIMKEGRPWVAIGTPGGHTIGQTVPQMIMNLIDFGMDIQPAIAAGRVSFVEPDVLAVEDSIPEAVRRELEAKGHKLRVVRALGNAHGLMIDHDQRSKPTRFRGASDPRGRGRALAF
jgi:gamma-glutamyltranspeptidase/glutathione hydrolase